MGCEELTHHRDAGNIRNCLLPQDDFLRELPHSAAPLGSHQCLEMTPKRQSHFFQPSRRNLHAGQRVQSHGDCLLWSTLPAGHHAKIPASASDWGDQFWKALQRCWSRPLLSPFKTQHQGSIKTHQTMRRRHLLHLLPAWQACLSLCKPLGSYTVGSARKLQATIPCCQGLASQFRLLMPILG